MFKNVLRYIKFRGESLNFMAKAYGESPNFMAKARIVSTKKAPEDIAEPEELRSWNHVLHFHQNVSRPQEKTCLLQAR